MEVKAEKTVDVVIPTYERPKNRSEENGFVIEAVKSVLAQTYPVNHIFVIIDGRSDIIQKELDFVPGNRLSVIESGDKIGGSNARNLGVLKSQAQYIAFLDDDDLWAETKIFQQISALKNVKGNAFAFTAVNYEEKQGYVVHSAETLQPNSNLIDYWLLDDGFIVSSSIVANRNLMMKVPFRKLKKFQDTDWYLRAYQSGAQVVQIPEALIYYRTQYASRKSSVSNHQDWLFASKWLAAYAQGTHRNAIRRFFDLFVIPYLYMDQKSKIQKLRIMFSFRKTVSFWQRFWFSPWLFYRASQRAILAVSKKPKRKIVN